MKKTMAKLVALLLIFSMVMPMTAQAATTYDLSVTISDKASPEGAKESYELSGSLSTLTGETKLVEALAQIVMANYESLKNFKSYAMKERMDAGLDIAKPNGTNNTDDWTNYARHTFTCDAALQGKLSDYSKTLSDYGVGTYVVTHKNDDLSDAKRDVTYTVTFTISEHQYGGGTTTPTKPTNPVVIIADDTKPGTTPGTTGPMEGQTTGVVKDGGTVEISKPAAATGEAVTVTAKPNEDKMINYVVVRDKDGNKVPLTYDGEGNYTFEVPEGGVTVTTTFRQEPADPAETGVAEVLDTNNHVAFMVGDDEGMFRPNDDINRAEVATIFYRLLRDKTVEQSASFTDVSSQAWYAEAVETLAAIGIIKGVGENSFQPMRSITRAEFAAVCARFAKALVGGETFSDVNGHWAAGEISTAAFYGWIYGYEDGTFAPDKPITRQEAAAIVNRMLYRLGDQIAIDGGHTREFPDVTDTMWSWYEIAEATFGHDHEQEDKFAHEFWEN